MENPVLSQFSRKWLEAEVRPQVLAMVRNVSSGFCALGVDAHMEGAYLATCCAQWLEQEGLAYRGIELEDDDPYHCWELFFGVGENPGLLPRRIVGEILLLENGGLLPAAVIRNGNDFILSALKATGTVCLAPMLQGEYEQIKSVPGVTGLQLQPFTQVSVDVRHDLILHLVQQSFSSYLTSEQESCTQALQAACPTSLTELLAWIDRTAGAVDVELSPTLIPFTDTREPLIPAFAASKPTLEAQFAKCLEKLLEIDHLFQAWAGRPLLKSIVGLSSPFVTNCELSWFVNLVSWMSCRLGTDGIDPEDSKFIQKLDLVDHKVEASTPHLYFKSLHRLRTVHQHGILVDGKANKEKIRDAETWYAGHCGKAQPSRGSWRPLTSALLQEWAEAIHRWQAVLQAFHDDPSQGLVYRRQLDQERGLLSDDDWREAFHAAIASTDPTLEMAPFFNKHLIAARASLAQGPSTASSPMEAATQVAIQIVVAESRRFPLSARDFPGLSGPAVGKAKGYAQDLWKQNPFMDIQELKQRTMAWYRALQPDAP